jgi:hypothetical protein
MTDTERYMVTATGTKDGNAYSALTRIISGTKANGDTYEFADTKGRTIREKELLVVGQFLEYRTARVAG